MRLRRLVLAALLLVPASAIAADATVGLRLTADGGMRVRAGETIVADAAPVTLRLLDDARLVLAPGTQLVVDSLVLGEGGRQSRLEAHLLAGRVSYASGPGWSALATVTTASAIVLVTDGAASIATDDSGTSLAVCRDRVEISRIGRIATVGTGDAVTAAPDGTLTVLPQRDPALCAAVLDDDAAGLTGAAALRQEQAAEAAPEGLVGAGAAGVLGAIIKGVAGGDDAEVTPTATPLTTTPSSAR